MDAGEDAARAAIAALGGRAAKPADADIITFRRSVNASGAGSFAVNGKTVSWDAYGAILKSIGVLVKARNFLVFQGDVEAIAVMKPAELTTLFETVSGSSDLKDDYEAARGEKDKAEQETIFNFQKKKGIAAEKKQVKMQKEEAERFTSLIHEQKQVKREHLLWQLFQIDEAVAEQAKAKAVHERELAKIVDAQAAIEKEMKARKQAQATAAKQAAVHNKDIGKLHRAMDKQKPTAIKLKETVAHLEKKLTASRKSEAKIRGDSDRHASTVAELESELAKARKALAAWEKETAAHRARDPTANLSEADVAEYQKLKEAARIKAAAEQQHLAQLEREQSADEQMLATLKNKREDIAGRTKALGEKQEALAKRRSEVSEYLTRTKAQVADLETKLEDLEENAKETESREKELTLKLEKTQETLREMKADEQETKRDEQLRKTIDTLKRLFPGVRGRLLDLAKPKKAKYNVAVTVILGRNMDAVIVDTEKTALDAIRYMKENRLGTATFIPLDTVKTKNVDEHHRQLGPDIQLVMDVISIDAAMRKALLYACGNAVVCTSLDVAKRLCFGKNDSGMRYKAVTLDGTVIHRSGMMTGGLAGIENRARRWDAKELDSVKSHRDSCLKELAELGRAKRTGKQAQRVDMQVAGLRNRLNFSEVDFKQTTDKIASIETEQKNLAKEAAVVAKDVGELEKKLAARARDVAKATEARDVVERAVFADFARRVKVDNIQEFESHRLARAEAETKQRLELTNKVAKFENQRAYETSRDLAEPLAKMAAQIKAAEAEHGAAKKDLDKAQAALDKLGKDLDALEKETRGSKAKMQELDAELKADGKRVEEKALQVVAVQKEVAAHETRIEQQLNRRETVLQQATVEQIDVTATGSRGGKRRRRAADESQETPEEDEEDEAGEPASPSSTQTSAVTSAGDKRSFSEAIGKIDYASLAAEHRKYLADTNAFDAVNSEFVERLARIQVDMDRIDPNLKAQDRFEDVQNRLKETNEEFETARGTARTAADAFHQRKKERTERFMEAFNHISARIDGIYKELTKGGERNDMGGTAYLTLENPDEPFSGGIKYSAMPPLQRFRDMEALSGGEKTVASLALLFAIQSYHPAPFFVLDEIDAALDADNVNKVAKYIARKSNSMQSVVISLKDAFYERAQSLVGVYRDQAKDGSDTMTLKLTDYAEIEEPGTVAPAPAAVAV